MKLDEILLLLRENKIEPYMGFGFTFNERVTKKSEIWRYVTEYVKSVNPSILDRPEWRAKECCEPHHFHQKNILRLDDTDSLFYKRPPLTYGQHAADFIEGLNKVAKITKLEFLGLEVNIE